MTEPRTPKTLLEEIHARSLWQVVLAYLGVSWAVLEAVALFSDRYGLPGWLFTTALGLLACGLLVVMVAGLFGAASGDSGDRARGRSAAPGTTWGRAGLTFLAACAAWGVIATAALISSRGETEALLTRGDVLGSLQRFADARQWDSAFMLSRAYEQDLAADSAFAAVRERVSRAVDLGSLPNGASVWWRAPWSEEWEELGSTPVRGFRLPLGGFSLRLEAEGHEGLEVSVTTVVSGTEFRLAALGSPHAGMVFVPGGDFQIQSPGLESLAPVTLGSYWIDRDEVTNAEYAEFVDGGAYRDPAYWTEPFILEGREISFQEAMSLLVDQTGLPGPSTWVGGDYAEGAGNHPVTGLAWYEAAAYARFRGKSLPTIYHWNRAATTSRASVITPLSNLAGSGLRDVATTEAVTGYGALDMGGNAREWCWNESDENRFILGGGWSDAQYMFVDAYTQPAWDRSEINGLRLALFGDDEDLTLAARSIPRPTRDFYAEAPISDERFSTYRSVFAYDRTELNTTTELVDSASGDWVREIVSFDAAYAGERMQAVLFTPRNVAPPYQTVVYFPGSNALFLDDTYEVRPGLHEFLPKNGRAFLVPIYRGTYGRGGNALLDTDQPSETVAYREVVVQWVRDLGRSIDYLQTRGDIDMDRLAFFGTSWGARMGVLMLAVEPRFQAAILFVGGLKHQRALPEADPSSYVHRVTAPVLMLNGRYDHFFPLESSQIPLFDLLGTPTQDKSHQVYDGGHSVPTAIVIRESQAWLDRYLGPVRQR
jgi:formylglycine-generating enzyme required for sulfatase activity/dienelactone hydrolase